MGCDIHGWLEIQEGEVWRAVADPIENDGLQERYGGSYGNVSSLTREAPYRKVNYSLYSILANVRSNETGLEGNAPRGVPEGVSLWVQADIDSWVPDGHSHSWYTLEELCSMNMGQLVTEDPEALQLFWDELVGSMLLLDVEPDKIRWVFWFDS